MILKKPIASISSYAHVHYLSACPSFAPRPSQTAVNRAYSTVNEETKQSTQDDGIWPQSSTSHSLPTPYEILHLKRNAPYTKHRFYQLVKIYHPDRRSHNSFSNHVSALPVHVIKERYRLVVTAHEILSDPVKRRAYDRHGTGWVERSRSPSQAWSESRTRDPFVWRRERRWSGFHANDSPFANATWEDWERWYERPTYTGARQQPLYTSNGTFITLVLSAVLAGAVGQRMMVEEHDALFQSQAKMAHEQAAECYREMLIKTKSFEDNHARMEDILKKREKGRPSDVGDAEDGFQRLLNGEDENAGLSEESDNKQEVDLDHPKAISP